MADHKANAVIYINGTEVNNTIRSIEGHARKLRAEMNNLTRGTAEFNTKLKELRATNQVLASHRQQVNGISSQWAGMRNTVKNFGATFMGIFAVGAVWNGIKTLISRTGQLDDALNAVRKTAGLTRAEALQLNRELGQINTRSSREELLKLAKEAGKLGYNSVGSIKNFVKQADQINVALGEDLGDGAITQIGKLANIFKTEMINIGSALNEVGKAGIASEGWQVDFLTRLSGIAETAELSLPDLLGYGATLESMGQTAEVSGTALNQFFLKFISNTGEFGRIAGFAGGELEKLIGEQGTNAGFTAFLEKLKETNPESGQMIQALNSMGLDGARASNILLTLANNTGEVASQQQIANEAFQDGTSITQEFNTQQEGMGAAMDRLGKRMRDIFLNNALSRGISNLVKGFADLVAPAKKSSDILREENLRLNSLVGAITNVNTNNELRKKYIEELKAEYPDYIKLVGEDFTNTNKLKTALQQVNAEYLKKIIVTRAGEDHAEAVENQADAYEVLDHATMNFNETLTKSTKSLGIAMRDGESLDEFIKRIDFLLDEGDYSKSDKNLLIFLQTRTIALREATEDFNGAQDESNRMLERQQQLESELNEKFKITTPGDAGNTNVIDDAGDSATDATVKVGELVETIKEAKELLRETQTTDPISGASFNEANAFLTDFEAQLEASLEQRKLMLDNYYDWAMAKTLKDKIESERITTLKWDSIHNIENGAISILGSLSEMAGAQNTKRGRAIALTQIALSKAAAIADVVRMAMEAAADAGPLGPLVYAGYFATGLATVLSGISQARGVLSADQKAEGGYADVVGRQTGRTYKTRVDQNFSGGYAGSALLVGEAGAEYTIPNWMMGNQYVVKTVDALEAIRTGRSGGQTISSTQGSSTSAGGGGGSDNSVLISLMSEMLQEMRRQKNYTVTMPYRTVTHFKEAEDEMNRLKNKSRK